MVEDKVNWAEWIAAIGTAGSLLLAMLILITDRWNRKREQAKGVHTWIEADNQGQRLMIRNLSNAPINMPDAYWRPSTVPEYLISALRRPLRTARRIRTKTFWHDRTAPTYYTHFEFGYLDPGHTRAIIPPPEIWMNQRIFVTFSDAANNRWVIDNRSLRLTGRWRREMRLNQKFGWSAMARRMGISVRELHRQLDESPTATTPTEDQKASPDSDTPDPPEASPHNDT